MAWLPWRWLPSLQFTVKVSLMSCVMVVVPDVTVPVTVMGYVPAGVPCFCGGGVIEPPPPQPGIEIAASMAANKTADASK